MKQEIKNKWLVALRSGEYQQSKGGLKKDNTYCCLGVLCDLYRKETGIGEWVNIIYDMDYNNFHIGEEISYGVPSKTILDWAGLLEDNPSVKYENKNNCLAVINDSGVSFNEIADIIEKEL